MAIIIPSKNIYGQIDNPKVIDNLVNNVTVSQTVITPDNEYEVSVFNISKVSSSVGSPKIKTERNWRAITGGGAYYSAVAYAKLTDLYDTIDLDIPILKTDKYVSKLLLGDNDDGYPNIKYRLIGDVEKGTCTAYIDVDDTISRLTHTPTYSKTEVDFDIPELKATATGTTTIGAPAVTVTSELIVPSESNISSITADDSDGVVFKIRSLKLLTGMTKYEMGGGSTLESGGSTNTNYSGTITGSYETYIPHIFEITFYGNTIGISLEDGTILYGSGNKPHSLSGNELMQDSARTDGVLTTKRLADNVLLQYGNGKETATIMCGIADYYNQNTFVKATQVSNYFQLSEYGSRNAVSATDQNTHIALTETDNSLKATQENGVLRLKYSGVDKAISVTRNFKNLFGDVLVLPLPGGFVQNDNSFYIETNYEDPIENAMPNWSYDVNTKRHYTNISKSVSNYIVYADFDVYTVGGDEHNYSIDLDLSELPDGDYNVSYIYKVVNNVFHLQNFIVCAGSETPNDYPMVFNITDVVVPMIRSPYGADIPLSDNTDGSPKMFSVASRNITYDGSVLQKLNLQELVTRMIKYSKGVVLRLRDYIGNKVNVNLSTPKNPSENVNLVVNNRNLILNMASRNWFGVVMTQTNGTYVLNGTCETSFNFEGYEFYLPAGTYTLSANNPATNNLGHQALCQVYSSTVGDGITAYDNVEYSQGTYTLKYASNYRFRIRCQQGVTYNNFIIKPQLELNEQSTEYIEPSRTVYAFGTDGKVENVQLKDTETVMFADNGAEIQTQYTMLKQN